MQSWWPWAHWSAQSCSGAGTHPPWQYHPPGHFWSMVKKVPVKATQSSLCYPMDYITVHGIFQARMLEWAAFCFSRGSSQPRDQTLGLPGLPHCRSPTLQVDSLPAEPQEKSKNTGVGSLSLLQWSSWSGSRSRVSCIAGRCLTNVAIRETWWQVHKHNVTSLKTYILWLFPFSSFYFFSGFCTRFSCFYPKVILSWSCHSVWAHFLPNFLQIIHREIPASGECSLVFTG